MSISLIRAQNPQAVVTDGYILSLAAKDLDELIGDQVRALRELERSWQGDAANAARARAYRDIQRQHRLHEILAALADAMQSGAAALVQIRQTLLAWVDSVSATFDVSDAGVVTPRPPNDTAPWVAIAATFTKLIQQLIEAFLTADQQLAASLKSIAAGHIPGNDPVPMAGVTPPVDPDSLNNPQLRGSNPGRRGQPVHRRRRCWRGEHGPVGHGDDARRSAVHDPGRHVARHRSEGTDGRTGSESDSLTPRAAEEQHHLLEDGRTREMGARRGRQRPIPDRRRVDDPDVELQRRRHDVHLRDGRGQLGQRHMADQQFAVVEVDRWRANMGKMNAVWQNRRARQQHPFQVQSITPNDDGYIYMYGTTDGRDNDGLHVARVPAGAVEDPSQYQYWNGSRLRRRSKPDDQSTGSRSTGERNRCRGAQRAFLRQQGASDIRR